ncbi:Short-chain dehydrogenase/reductase family protein [Trichoderma simmonsii]|uniref:Short-chain dehydrogenase/reductase family protein n=1 Tax=Trichoderma simmonsii TaxID=1491479 RepID=A0A8G0PIE4_9HYPO|nr:Short-chain dehydrogenase/reductase family protein [Trichoderma simmonsii]
MSASATDRALVQTRELPLNISKELCAGRTYIVTGANVGLGLEAARHLVGVGAAKVILAVRNLEAGEAAKKDIEASTGIKGVAEVWHLDLSSYASVRAFASKAVDILERIDAVIENAAVAGSGGKAEGHVLTLTVNVISTFLLAVLLLPKLRSDSAKYGYTPRLSIVSSGTGLDLGEYWSKIANDPIVNMDADDELGMKSYPASKMMEIFAVREIARLLPVARGGVIINLINPGLCETSLSRNAPEEFKANLNKMLEQCGRTAECGSRTLLAAAVAGEDSHGSYMDDCVPADNMIPDWMDATANKQGWDSIAKELEKIEPGCVSRALE